MNQGFYTPQPLFIARLPLHSHIWSSQLKVTVSRLQRDLILAKLVSLSTMTITAKKLLYLSVYPEPFIDVRNKENHSCNGKKYSCYKLTITALGHRHLGTAFEPTVQKAFEWLNLPIYFWTVCLKEVQRLTFFWIYFKQLNHLITI